MKIGIVSPEAKLANLMERQVRDLSHEPVVASTIREAIDRGARVVFAEWQLAGDARLIVSGIQRGAIATPSVPVVLLLSVRSSDLLRRGLELGASDCLYAPPDTLEVRAEIEELVLEAASPADLIDREVFENLRATRLIGESPKFRSCMSDLRLAIRSQGNVLIEGETGTGKEMFARSIHDLSRRSGSPYAAVNCASLPEPLLASALFGHARGSFSGADRDRAGWFEAAGAGTLFLDEIGELSLPLQAQLLRAVDERAFHRVGETHLRALTARLLTATSVKLDEAVQNGRFRPDLMARLNHLRIKLPPLRERRDDIPLLARHFLQKYSPGRFVDLSSTALEVLMCFSFPMNVRQLEKAIATAVARCGDGSVILPKHLPEEFRGAASHIASHNITVPSSLPYGDARQAALTAVDEIYLENLLRKHGGNQSRAAEEAGIDRKTFAARYAAATGTASGDANG